MAVKITIFEDNNQLRNMICQMIDLSDGLSCTGSYSDAIDLDFKIRRSEPEIVLMDIDMPEVDGVEAVKRIKENFPKILIMMQTVFEDNEKVFDSLCSGADGYLLKNSISNYLITSIWELYKGGAPMSFSIAKKVLTRFKEQNPCIKNDDYKLTDREKELLTCLKKGMSYKMIAHACYISVDTVKFHIKKIYEKLHVNSKSEAAIKALHHRIINN